MNKAFEKILERLEERKQLHERMISYEHENGTITEEYQARKAVDVLNDAKEIVQEVAEEYNGGWIAIKTRPMTEEEKEYYSEYLSEGNGMIYDCHLPDDGQEVLITSKYGSVDKTTFYTDCVYYFENYEDYDEVIAWQPLPEQYKERD